MEGRLRAEMGLIDVKRPEDVNLVSPSLYGK
jgi:hypothetical protein